MFGFGKKVEPLSHAMSVTHNTLGRIGSDMGGLDRLIRECSDHKIFGLVYHVSEEEQKDVEAIRKYVESRGYSCEIKWNDKGYVLVIKWYII